MCKAFELRRNIRHSLPELGTLSWLLQWGSVCPFQAASWPYPLSKEALGVLWAGRHQDGHRGSWVPSAGGVVLALCVFVLNCPASGFSQLVAIGLARLPRLGLDRLRG